MNKEQSDNTSLSINQLANTSTGKIDVFPDDHALGKGKASEIFRRNISLFEQAIRDRAIESFPAYYKPKDSSGDAFLLNTLTSLSAALEKGETGELEYYLLDLNSYVYQSGLIHLLATTPFIQDVQQLSNLQSQIEGLRSRLEKDRINQIESLQKLEDTKQDINAFKASKEGELTAITNNLAAAENHQKLIATILDDARVKQNDINVIFTEGGLKRESVVNEFNVFKTDVEQLLIEVRTDKVQQENLIKEHNNLQEDAKQLTTKSTQIRAELERLLNPAIAQNLLETFKQRKEKLFRSMATWAIISGVLFAFFAWYAWYLFNNEHTSTDLKGTLITAIKLLPVVTFAIFAVRQYAMERNLQEEYAFRESIATSLMSYAEQIAHNQEEKDKLIKETVDKLYRSPVRNKSRSSSLFPGRKKMMKEITELAKEFNNFRNPNGS